MKAILLGLCLFALISSSCGEPIPFLNVFMKALNTKTLQTLPFYWGPSGNFELFQDTSDPANSMIQLTFSARQGSNHFLLNQTQVQAIQNYVKYQKIVDFVVLKFPASQIALSQYNSKYCGLFSDEEDTYDIDMPINPIGKDESSNLRLEFNFEFDLKYQDKMSEIYSFLDTICRRKAH